MPLPAYLEFRKQSLSTLMEFKRLYDDSHNFDWYLIIAVPHSGLL